MNADRLREAARVLRERAEACAEESLHPWVTEDDTPRDFTTVIDQNGWRVTEGPDQMVRPVAYYIATMHPGVGLALADWLDDLAAGWAWDEDGNGGHWDDGTPMRLDEAIDSRALALAVLILGGTS